MRRQVLWNLRQFIVTRKSFDMGGGLNTERCRSGEEKGCLSRQMNVAGERCVVVEGTKDQDIGSAFLASPDPCC